MALKPIQILINAKDNASAVFGSLQAKVAAVGTAIAGYFSVKSFAGIVQGAAEFEAAMSRVQAATGASAEEVAGLKKAAEEAGASTKYTAVEAAGALENLAKAGLDSAQAIETLPAVLNLAQAADIGLGESAEFVTKAVMGMGLQFSDAARVADVLALGANATNTSVTGLAQALSYAAPVASSLGLSLESTVAMMGKLADAGIDASRAGTGLSSIMAQFSDPASKFRLALADAGIVTGDFEEALHQLAAAGPRGEKAIQAVGLNAGPALRSLLNQGMDALDELTFKLENSAGSAEAAAKVMQDNLQGSMTGLASAWDTVKNVLGTPVLPVIKDGVDQLAAALRGAVSDGTITRFGESIATAFQNGLKWVREFIGSIDFDALTTKLQGWADEAAATFDKVGVYATNAGNIVKTAWGVMKSGSNTVLGIIYSVGEAFSLIASGIQTGLAKIMDGFAKVTFGDLSASFKAAAEEVRLSAEATGAAADALRDKATQAFLDAADAAQLARDGVSGLASDMGRAAAQATTTGKAVANLAAEQAKGAEAAAKAGVAYQKKIQAEEQARQSADAHRQALATLREEYAQLVAGGDLQAAAEKLEQINQALRNTAGAGKDATRAAEDAAKQIEAAFSRLGVTSTQALKDQAAAAQRDFEIIRDSGETSAEDVKAAFKVAADAAIAANKGVAPSWVQAQAGVQGYRVEVDEAGKASLVATDKVAEGADKGKAAAKGMGDAMQGAKGAIEDVGDAAEKAGDQIEEAASKIHGAGGGIQSMMFTAANATSKYAYEVTRAMWASVDWASVSRQQFAAMSDAANRLVEQLEDLDRAQARIQASTGGAASELANLQDRLLELSATEEEVARARAQREKDDLATKMQLAEIEIRRMELLRDPSKAPELAAKREELALLQQQMGVLDTIHKKEQQQRDKARREREAEEKRRKAEDKRRDDERRREQSAPAEPTSSAPRPPAPAPAAPPADGRSRDSFQPSHVVNISLGGGRSYGVNTDAAGASQLEGLMRELERGKLNTGW